MKRLRCAFLILFPAVFLSFSLLTGTSFSLLTGTYACAGESTKKIPVIYCSDLYHPHVDMDDHFDLACIFALSDAVEIKAVILDDGDREEKAPGKIPLSQMNTITGMNVPSFIGLSEPLKTPGDKGLDQPAVYQKAVDEILSILRDSPLRVTIITIGSVRDVAAAFNRDPGLFERKAGRIYIFIGDGSEISQTEYNVELDPNAFNRLMNSGLQIYWVPCYDRGVSGVRASYWKAKHSDLLENISGELMNYFVYALTLSTADPEIFLKGTPDEAVVDSVLSDERNLWCSAVFAHAANQKFFQSGDGKSVEIADRKPSGNWKEVTPFVFKKTGVIIDEKTRLSFSEEKGRKIYLFNITDKDKYSEIMTKATNSLLKRLPGK